MWGLAKLARSSLDATRSARAPLRSSAEASRASTPVRWHFVEVLIQGRSHISPVRCIVPVVGLGIAQVRIIKEVLYRLRSARVGFFSGAYLVFPHTHLIVARIDLVFPYFQGSFTLVDATFLLIRGPDVSGT